LSIKVWLEDFKVELELVNEVFELRGREGEDLERLEEILELKTKPINKNKKKITSIVVKNNFVEFINNIVY
jgi:phosphotransferase system IIA component